jgi:hypothetical protein
MLGGELRLALVGENPGLAPLHDRLPLCWRRCSTVAALLLALAACTPEGPRHSFRNPATGAVVDACGPYPGLARAVAAAEQGCADAYKSAGWQQVDEK